jgi:hypothetical protein
MLTRVVETVRSVTEAVGTYEKSANVYQTTRHNIPGGSHLPIGSRPGLSNLFCCADSFGPYTGNMKVQYVKCDCILYVQLHIGLCIYFHSYFFIPTLYTTTIYWK